MNNNSKTFRLFISSTFNDFQVEREALQTKVFPEIKEYCSSNGYTFQPIDLRWGVSNEAQLNQKALEMCIKEVQSCKRHEYPNFLIMLGDRYGWIPLPNIIEQNEFEQIMQNLDTGDKDYLTSWYYEDANQIPISYILKQRADEYEEYDKWLKVESKLRDIFQTAVSDLGEDIKRKYFTSATEAEASEGIISYSQKSEFQQKLLKLIPNLEQVDHKNIFGFFRSIDKDSIIEDKFISTDYDQAQSFKEQVQAKLIDENILNVSTTQISKDKLDESYIDKFIQSVTNFLKQQVDNQILKDKEKDYSDLEIEKLQQQFFMNQKLENFLGQEKILQEIQNYISNENDKPLIICGQSGIGKSSIIAKAIEDTSIQTSKKIVYRFIGATPNSRNTKDLLTSILEELEIVVEDQHITENNNQLLTDIDKKENAFVEFSKKVYDEIYNIKDDIVIFIDAVDQFSNDDQFLWLPNKLPSNIKIVISALKDRDYKEDSKYFYTLEDKISSYIEIEPFDKPAELLELLLLQQKRTLQLSQKEYFLKQYNKVRTPLYVYMASNQMQYWKNNDLVDIDITLSLSQKDIVKSFIENLTSIHHHDKLLVQKVFGYILASKDGLSEYEILELLNTDKKFIKHLALDTWHINTTQELPLVIWTRLYNHIKPFLSTKNKDGQELLYFFHREFIDAVENQTYQQKEHESIIEATQKLILKHQDQEFDSNRWGKLYAILLTEYFLKYQETHKLHEYTVFITNLTNENYIENFYNYCAIEAFKYQVNYDFKRSSKLFQINYLCSKELYDKNQFTDTSSYTNELCKYAQDDYIREKLGLEVEDEVLTILENFTKESKWTTGYINSIANFTNALIKNNQVDDAIDIQEIGIKLSGKLYSDNPYLWTKQYIKSLISLSNVYSNCQNHQRSIELLLKSNEIIELMYLSENQEICVEDYIQNIYLLSREYNALNNIEYARIYGDKSLEIIKTINYHEDNNLKMQFFIIITNTSMVNLNCNNIGYALTILEENLSLIEDFYNFNPSRNSKIYINYLTSLAVAYSEYNNKTKSIEILELLLEILENLYKQNESIWLNDYILVLVNLATVNNDLNYSSKAKEYALNTINLIKYYFDSNNMTYPIEKNYLNALLILCEANQKQNNTNKALEYGLEGIKIIEAKYSLDNMNWAYSYLRFTNSIANVYITTQMLKEAIYYYEKALIAATKMDRILPYPSHKQPLDCLSILVKLYASLQEHNQVLEKGETYIELIEDIYPTSPTWFTNQYLFILPIIATSYALINETPTQSDYTKTKECIDNYFEKYNLDEMSISDLQLFIFSLVSYYRLFEKLNDHSIINCISEKVVFLKNKFFDDYENQLENIRQNLKNMSSISEKHHKSYEAFIEIFIDEKYLDLNTKKRISKNNIISKEINNKIYKNWIEWLKALKSSISQNQSIIIPKLPDFRLPIKKEFTSSSNTKMKELIKQFKLTLDILEEKYGYGLFDCPRGYISIYVYLADLNFQNKNFSKALEYFDEYFIKIFDDEILLEKIQEYTFYFSLYYYCKEKLDENVMPLDYFIEEKIEFLKNRFGKEYKNKVLECEIVLDNLATLNILYRGIHQKFIELFIEGINDNEISYYTKQGFNSKNINMSLDVMKPKLEKLINTQNIKKAILSILDKEGLNTCFEGLLYETVLNYAQNYGKIVNEVGEYYIEFIVEINSVEILVSLNKQPFDEHIYAILGATTEIDYNIYDL